MENREVIKFTFLLSGGEEISRVMELRGKDAVDFVGIRRYGERYAIDIGPHTIDIPGKLMKELVETILLIYPDYDELREIIGNVLRDKPWLLEGLIKE